MIAFTTQWLLWGLLVLPLVFVLTRLRPPPLRQVRFPAFDLLPPDQGTSVQTPPPWLLVLRLVTVAALVVGLAGPRWQTGAPVANPPHVTLVMDDSWAAAVAWSERIALLDARLATLPAATPITVVRTASGHRVDGTAAAARSWIKHWGPEPWPVDENKTVKALQTLAKGHVWYVSDGLLHASITRAAKQLGSVAQLSVPAPLVRIAGVAPNMQGLRVTLHRADTAGTRTGQIRAGTVVAPYGFAPGSRVASVQITPPQTAEAITLDDGRQAGAIWPLTAEARRPKVEVMTTGVRTPLSDADVLLKALDGMGQITATPASRITASQPDAVILTDQRIDAAVQAALLQYAELGGTVIRFAGEHLAETPDAVTPAPTQTGARVLTGTVSWSKTQSIAPYASTGPFAGLIAPRDVRVHTTVVYAPEQEARVQILARLADGSPLITMAPRGRGQIVLIHTTAGPAWSDWPLNTHYRDVLQRLIRMAARQAPTPDPGPVCAIQQGIDGFGALSARTGGDVPLSKLNAAATAQTPPGVYVCGDVRVVHPVLPAHAVMVPVQETTPITSPGVVAWGGWLIALAGALALLDLCARARSVMLVLALSCMPLCAAAASDTAIGYITQGTSEDALSKAGINALSAAISTRTTARMEPAIAIRATDPDIDLLPLIYWPISTATPTPAPSFAQALNRYMGNGGLVWVDLTETTDEATARATLARVLAPLTPPPLAPLPKGHVITKAFYLIDECPGAIPGAGLWVERASSAAHLDGVATLLVGHGDWRRAWAGGVDRARQEAAIRCGINVALYALVGNYKADQIHAKDLIERMQRRGAK